METHIEPKKARTVTFSVTEDEARSIHGWLSDALHAQINTPYASASIIGMRNAFKTVAENK